MAIFNCNFTTTTGLQHIPMDCHIGCTAAVQVRDCCSSSAVLTKDITVNMWLRLVILLQMSGTSSGSSSAAISASP